MYRMKNEIFLNYFYKNNYKNKSKTTKCKFKFNLLIYLFNFFFFFLFFSFFFLFLFDIIFCYSSSISKKTNFFQTIYFFSSLFFLKNNKKDDIINSYNISKVISSKILNNKFLRINYPIFFPHVHKKSIIFNFVFPHIFCEQKFSKKILKKLINFGLLNDFKYIKKNLFLFDIFFFHKSNFFVKLFCADNISFCTWGGKNLIEKKDVFFDFLYKKKKKKIK